MSCRSFDSEFICLSINGHLELGELSRAGGALMHNTCGSHLSCTVHPLSTFRVDSTGSRETSTGGGGNQTDAQSKQLK